MLYKLESTIEELIKSNRIKNKWSQVELLGISELINNIFSVYEDFSGIAHKVSIEDRVVCLNLYEGIVYRHEGEIHTLIRSYLDAEGNVIFRSRREQLFVFEMEFIDAEDYRHYYEGE